MNIRISARRSDLARLQAYLVGSALERIHPGIQLDYLFKESLGDKNLNDPLWKMPERGVFTEDFVSDLREGRTDIVVHSWKDLPTEPRPGLVIAATLPRADPRDLLLLRKDRIGQSRLKILTSSPRRHFSAQAHLAALLPFPVEKLETAPVRGNVATRMKKLAAGEGDGLFLAKAGLDRLLDESVKQEDFSASRREIRELLATFSWMVLPLSLFPTAPAQGALAIEIASERKDLATLLAPLHDELTAACVQRERSRFAAFGGGCHQKIGITVLSHSRLGRIEFFHGHPDGGSPTRELSFPDTPSPLSPQLSFWPEKRESIFQRRKISGVENPGTSLFVARADALPEGWKLGETQTIWCAGVQTWKKLAARGIWVHGCSDGLGEEIPELKALSGTKTPWTKLTHSGSANKKRFPCLATYELIPAPGTSPPVADAYFWPSESVFRWALSLRPEIRQGKHAAGPGYTAEAIEKELGRSIDVYYNYAHWRTGNGNEET